MFTMTDSAGALLSQFLRTKQVAKGSAVRIAREDREIAFMVDKIRPGDHGYQYRDRIVLVLGDDVRQALAGKMLRCESSEEGPCLVIQDNVAE
jgi:hypothetical protein